MSAANPAPGFAKYPDHKITLEPLGKPVSVSVDGVSLARSDDAILMREGTYTPVVYIPFSGIEFGKLARTETSTHCPFKGDASYWRISGGSAGPDIMWSYENPYDDMAEIQGYGAFYGDRVTIEVG
ncbi:MAG: DUF427 domain-containing protein [Rhizobiaceae bacterium]